jgi:hypothetical protein
LKANKKGNKQVETIQQAMGVAKTDEQDASQVAISGPIRHHFS